MTPIVKIDEIDDQILHILIQNARTSLKDIGKKCGISTVTVLNRIKRLKETGVITGAALFAELDVFHFQIVASIGMEIEASADVQEILEFFEKNTYLVEPSTCIGKYDLQAVIYAEDIASLNNRIEMVRRLRGIKRVMVSVWSGIPYLSFDNINFTSREDRKRG
jgi:Lrp/AsnC family transcriptional regulator, regulator for asnA, asnC and gidA